MFDGVLDRRRFPMRQPRAPRPAPIDTRKLLPLLRVQAAEAALASLAHVVAGNQIAYCRWPDLNWPGSDFADPAHPARVASLEESSPCMALVRAQEALDDACRRYRSATGDDGLRAAYEIIERGYGRVVADTALRPLTKASSLWKMLDETAPAELESPAPDPTPEQWRTGRLAIAEWMLSDLDLAGLAERLGALQCACDAGNAQGDPGAAAALQAVGAVISDILARGVELELVQMTLDAWAAASGGPQIRLSPGAD